MTLFPALALGFVLGLRHATDPDHVAAIGTIASDARSTKRAALIGATWGVGHSLSVLLVGGALVLMRLPMPQRLALALEFVVALMLIGLGIWSLAGRARASDGERMSVRPLLIGVVHGLAGTAVLALLVIGSASSAAAAIAYLLLFCVGTVAGMGLVTAVLMLPARASARHGARFQRIIRVAAGIASIGIGLALAHQVGIEDGLFAGEP